MIENLNKHFSNRVRLGIMSVLMVNEMIDFTSLKETLKVTDGNLSSNVTALQKNGYLSIKKEFVANKPKTSYQATRLGRKEFEKHLNALELILKQRE